MSLSHPRRLWQFLFGKQQAASYSLAENMRTAEASGHGNKARRRAELLDRPQAFAEGVQLPLTCSEVDRLAELHGEGRIYRREPRVNFHD